jgi:hypothetical protein
LVDGVYLSDYSENFLVPIVVHLIRGVATNRRSVQSWNKALSTYPKHSCDLPEIRDCSAWSPKDVSVRGERIDKSLTNEMQLLMEPVAWLNMFSDARCFGSSIVEGFCANSAVVFKILVS